MSYALRVDEIRLQPFNILRVEDTKDGVALGIPILKAVVDPGVPLVIAIYVIPGRVKFYAPPVRMQGNVILVWIIMNLHGMWFCVSFCAHWTHRSQRRGSQRINNEQIFHI